MSIADSLAAELQHEAATTRRLLERVPDERFDWRPHERSWDFGHLASHVADLLEWVQPTLELDEMVISEDYKPWLAGSNRELLERFDANVARAAEKLKGYPDSEIMKSWSLRSTEEVYFTMPRAVVLRSFVMNHLVHHRGQLSVYLRLNDIPVPSIYGPSADES